MNSNYIRQSVKGDRYPFTAKFNQNIISYNNKGIGQRLEFKDVRDEYGNYVADYVRFNNLKSFLDLDLQEGDNVYFHARYTQYESMCPHYAYNNPQNVFDRLKNPTKIKKLINPVQRIK